MSELRSPYFWLRNDYYLVDHCFGVVDHVRDQRQLDQLIYAVHYLQSESVHFGRWNHSKHTSHKRTNTSYNTSVYLTYNNAAVIICKVKLSYVKYLHQYHILMFFDIVLKMMYVHIHYTITIYNRILDTYIIYLGTFILHSFGVCPRIRRRLTFCW